VRISELRDVYKLFTEGHNALTFLAIPGNDHRMREGELIDIRILIVGAWRTQSRCQQTSMALTGDSQAQELFGSVGSNALE
jgi:hypothetical protein